MKEPWKPDPKWDTQNKTGVVEVCSVSKCISKRPPGWIQREGDSHDLLAHWVAPRALDDGAGKDLQVSRSARCRT